MSPDQALDYVRAAAVATTLPLDDARAQRVAGHLVVSAALARLVQAQPLTAFDEPAEIYRAAPFPDADGDEGP